MAAFVRDPDDHIPSGVEGLSMLTAQQGAVIRKWWESGSVTVPTTPDLLYTSESLEEQRWSSPGKFALFADGKCSQAGSLTVYCEYDVSFYEPAIADEGGKIGSLYAVLANCGPAGGNLYFQTDNSKVEAKNMIKNARAGDVYQLGSPRFYGRNTANVMSGIVSFMYVKVTGTTVYPCYRTGVQLPAVDQAFEYSRCLFEGETVRLINTGSKVAGEAQASQYLCLKPTGELETEVTSSFEVL